MSAREIVCVVGMGRSGTSLVTGLLARMGVAVGPGDTLLPSNARDNPTGYWEQAALNDLNDELLARATGAERSPHIWYRAPSLPDGWVDLPPVAELRGRAAQLLEDLAGDAAVFTFKDPRTSLTLPFWQRVAPTMSYVVCVRSPREVAESLRARSAELFGDAVTMPLWLRYHAAALTHTSGLRRRVVFYDELMRDPQAVAARLHAFVPDVQPVKPAELHGLVRPALWRNRSDMSELAADPGVPVEVACAYLLARMTGADGPLRQTDVVTQRLHEALQARLAQDHERAGTTARMQGLPTARPIAAATTAAGGLRTAVRAATRGALRALPARRGPGSRTVEGDTGGGA